MDTNTMTVKHDRPDRCLILAMLVFGTLGLGGCRTMGGPFAGFGNPFGGGTVAAAEEIPFEDDAGVSESVGRVASVRRVSGSESIEPAIDSASLADPDAPIDDDSLAVSAKKATSTITNLLTGRELEDRDRAKNFYIEGDRLFRTASGLEIDQRSKVFAQAAKQFRKASEAAPGSALAQDAMFMQAESLFFADQLIESSDTYEKLQKEFPRNRHNDRVAARLFSISRYWIETVKADESWIPINLTDASRPRMDTDGHAIRVLDQIRYDDPTGRLADDATMAAAAEYIRQEDFAMADEFLTDLRETFGDSEHLFLAHLLGIRCKLEVYAGPMYSGLLLEEAGKLVRQTRQRFPDKLADPKYGDVVARAAAEIEFYKAERLAYRASLREKQHEYASARVYYQEILEFHGETPQAETARKRLAEIENYRDSPPQRLSWLTTIFRESRPSIPLELKGSGAGEAAESPTMLR